MDLGLRPSASEISLPAPVNFPFGEDQVSSGSWSLLTILSMLQRLGAAAAKHHLYLVVCSDCPDNDAGLYNTAFLLGRDPDVILLYAESGVPDLARWRDAYYGRVVDARLAASDLIAEHYEARAFVPYGTKNAGYVVLVRR